MRKRRKERYEKEIKLVERDFLVIGLRLRKNIKNKN